jgi:hypothetical protein
MYEDGIMKTTKICRRGKIKTLIYDVYNQDTFNYRNRMKYSKQRLLKIIMNFNGIFF